MNVNTPIHFDSEQKAEFLQAILLNFMYLYIHGIDQLLNMYVIKQEFLLLNLVVKDETHLRHLETTIWPLFCTSSYI